jgi:hypothetical protein
LDTAKGKQRRSNNNQIRVTASFTPRTSGTGDYKRIIKELLDYASEFDSNVLMLPWDDKSGLGPISPDDLANPKTMHDVIKHYFDKPMYSNWQPGVPIYGVGFRFSTDMEKYEFLNRWNMQKRVYKEMKRVALTINLAPMQKSPNAYIIGIAVGSTENQNFETLNKRLEKDTG